jgi:Undecaprenyl-phosphate galactose phosphotransferase WbaP
VLKSVDETVSLFDLPALAAKPSMQGKIHRSLQKQSWIQWVVILILLFSDILLALLLWVALSTPPGIWASMQLFAVTGVSSVIYIVWLGMRALLGLYPGYGLDQPEELRRQTYAVAAAMAVGFVFALMFPPYFALIFQTGNPLSQLLLIMSFLGLLFFAPLLRYSVKLGLRKAGLWGKPVVILGADEVGRHLAWTLQTEWGLGYRPVAVFDNRLAPTGGAFDGVPYGGTLTDAMKLARARKVDTAILPLPHARSKSLTRFISRASARFRYVIMIPTYLSGITTSAVVARDLSGTLGVELKQNLLNPWVQRVKRTLDLSGVVVGGLLISPLLLSIIVLIKLESPGPALYKQQRPGTGGKYFSCWKFRTMRSDAESLLTKLLESNPDLRTEWERNQKLRDDPRITRIGRLLRRTSLDELPQLWNVLRGEMSLVGPRPMLTEEIPKYGEVYKLYKRMRPGMTGLWQVSGRSNVNYDERVAMVAYYVRNWSVWMDIIILSRTAKAIITGRGAS